MGLREKLEERPGVLAGVVSILVVLVCVGAWYELRTPPETGKSEGQLYYTVDDGKTYFADAATRETPFQKDGKEAVQAVVFSCDNNASRFVGYLQRSKPNAKPAAGEGKPGSQYNVSGRRLGIAVKRPGDAKWTVLASSDGVKITQVSCPDGKTRPIPVGP